MGVLILATNLNCPCRVEKVRSSLDEHQKILRWSVDLEDCDKVVRIEALDGFAEQDAIALIQAEGFIGKELDC